MSDFGFIRVAAGVPEVHIGRPAENADEILRMSAEASAKGAGIVCFPELSLTGCTAGDLLWNRTLLDGTLQALSHIKEASSDIDSIIIAGLPLEYGRAIYDSFAVIRKGHILGISVRMRPADSRHFPGKVPPCGTISICGENVAISWNQVFRCGNVTFSIQNPDKTAHPVADIILYPAGYTESAGRSAELAGMLRQRSADCRAAIVLASSGPGESTTDYLYAGHSVIAENGQILMESHFRNGLSIADIDIELLHNAQYDDIAFPGTPHTDVIEIEKPCNVGDGLMRHVSPTPFQTTDEVFADTFRIQTLGLVTRLRHTGISKVVIGISGGLDSTLALLVCANAIDQMGLDRKCVTGITMPGFGTTGRTYNNAVGMMRALGIDWREISIKEASLLHLRDIGHDIDVHDSAYENTQARERTQILMDVANEIGALVVGTGDLSELALGWCTYNGDHMSMYAVNASIPKTLIPCIIRYAAGMEQFTAASANLLDVIDTPITPELLPADNQGNIVQKTEDIIGPYELHDFFLYHFIKNRFSAKKILFLATRAFAGKYDEAEIRKWLSLFLKRFFNNQFKRSCMPDGPCCGPVTLSPRGGLQMPSDISSKEWLDTL